MEDPASAEESAFVADDVSNIIKESVDAVLQNQQYNEAKVSQWTSSCLENCIRKLAGLNKPFKYVVTCIIMQKNGAGLHTAASCWWDSTTDGSRTVRWENKSMLAITTVFGLAM
mmetsp:Transcript_9181/g.16112  ORF Transcript_9181/g.16112 Transcript_9181/m.16112 type:complete len:114 (+) Transcript_9181:132-473(+)|eukprot:CAMPEP_0119107836 /NCGR_PEP_ID=MMETSP1180-20130426/11823_1 /TAXON_ID=3052 ORGANISM="Chlamydomonas cf sp, Strain CCMP681" /NCGR_SAMPLE_ID=MMETSP1180 /ASSEMBLY_ACC=CAM_ASM_000741 /LENGTH=113 /DNA_ID=CAMNT_0007093381 /DNA_START=132 /DNA_END=473 /DNA_ORIENTATION=+